MAKSKKNGKTTAVSAADIVTPTDEVLAYPEQPQEIQEPEKTQPVTGTGGRLTPFEVMHSSPEEIQEALEDERQSKAFVDEVFAPDTDEQKPFLGVFEPVEYKEQVDFIGGGCCATDLEGDEKRISRDTSLAADLDIGVIGEQPESNGPWEPPNMNAGPVLPRPELQCNGPAGVSANRYTDEQCASFGSSEVRADIEAEHAGITLQDTDILSDTTNLQPTEPEPPRPSPRGSDYVPPVGSWWSMPTAEPYALIVCGEPTDSLVLCRDYVRSEGVVFMGMTKIALDDFRVGLLVLELACPDWVYSGRKLTDRTDERSSDQVLYERHGEPVAPSNPENGAAEVANELGVEVRDVQLIVDSVLHSVAGFFALKSVASCSPIVDAAAAVLNTPAAVGFIGSLLSKVVPVVGIESVRKLEKQCQYDYEKLTGFVRRVEDVTRANNERLNQHTIGEHVTPLNFTELAQRCRILEGRVDGLVATLESYVARSSAPDIVSDDGIMSNAVFQLIQKELNPIREDMASLQDRQDLVERKRLMADEQKRKNQKAHHDSMKKPKAEQLEVRRARDKTARKLKAAEAEKVGEIKRGRGRPRTRDKDGNLIKKPTGAKSVANPPKSTAKPVVVPVDLVAGMMKKSPDKKVEKLLRGLDAKQLKRISDQFPNGLPDVYKIPGWVEADRFAFVRWYFGQSGN